MGLPVGVDTVGARVRYAEPCNAEEAALRFRVIEDNGTRVVLRVEGWDNPVLVPTELVARGAVVLAAPEAAERARVRAETYPGIARAMAEQWGAL